MMSTARKECILFEWPCETAYKIGSCKAIEIEEEFTRPTQ